MGLQRSKGCQRREEKRRKTERRLYKADKVKIELDICCMESPLLTPSGSWSTGVQVHTIFFGCNLQGPRKGNQRDRAFQKWLSLFFPFVLKKKKSSSWLFILMCFRTAGLLERKRVSKTKSVIRCKLWRVVFINPGQNPALPLIWRHLMGSHREEQT